MAEVVQLVPTVLYYGADRVIETPSLDNYIPGKDFSKGLYFNCAPKDAERMARTFIRVEHPVVNVYEFAPAGNLVYGDFSDFIGNVSWLHLLTISSTVGNRDRVAHTYDVIRSVFLNTQARYWLNLYLSNDIDRDDLWDSLGCMKVKPDTQQVSLHTSAAIACLKFKGFYEL